MSKKPTPASKTRVQSAGTNQLRIIGGQWRGRKLSFPDVNGLRPTGDRIRETLFNWLQGDVHKARVLDVFAGSGALGLEALSRGASFSLLVEKDGAAARSLAANLQLLNVQHARLLQTDALAFLRAGRPEDMEAFNLVFIDPPFALNLWDEVIAALESGHWLSAEAIIYLELPKAAPCHLPENWQIHRDKSAGQVNYRLYYRKHRV